MPKVYLDRIQQRYGWTGGPYRTLMKMICAECHESVSRAVGRIKVRDMKDMARRMSKRKVQPAQMEVPNLEEVLPKRSVFIRKGATQGELLSDSLRTKLSKDLRGAVSEFLQTGKESMQYRRGERKGRMNPELVDRFEEQIRKTFAGYTKAGPDGVPHNVRAIAITETRAAVDAIKWEFANRLLAKNKGAQAAKRWKHNPRLSKVPRPGHREIDGETIEMSQVYRVKHYEIVGYDKGIPKFVWNGVVHDMRFPHDPGSVPEQVINCNCDIDYVFQFPKKGV